MSIDRTSCRTVEDFSQFPYSKEEIAEFDRQQIENSFLLGLSYSEKRSELEERVNRLCIMTYD